MILFKKAHFTCNILRNSANMSSRAVLHTDGDDEALCNTALTENILN